MRTVDLLCTPAVSANLAIFGGCVLMFLLLFSLYLALD